MIWNWEQPDWPNFTFDPKALDELEQQFLLRSGEFIGAFKHIGSADQNVLKIELISDEALKTSEIEGELLDRESVQSSLRQQFGLGSDQRRIAPAERGVAEMMVNLYETYAAPLTHETMFAWHRMLMSGDWRIEAIGSYRTHADPMQIVSGKLHEREVYFEAPPSSKMEQEMDAFVAWFNESRPGGKHPLPALTRAGIAHLYFVSIHPFEDGNGRIGRALAEKSLAQSLGQPSLIALAYTIERERKAYYKALQLNNKDTEITPLADVFRQNHCRGAAQYDQARRLLHRESHAVRKAARPTQRAPGQGDHPHVPRRDRWLQRRPERGELRHHFQDVPSNSDEGFAGPRQQGRAD